MSLYDYKLALDLDRRGDWDGAFYAVVMVLYKNADTTNRMKLETAWPDVCTEYRERHNAPMGLLIGESTEGWKRTEEGLHDPDGKLVRAI